MALRFDLVEKSAETLRQVADRFATDSPEYSAIRLAALALIYATMNNAVEFAQFVEDNERELTTEQRKYVEGLRGS